MKVFISSVVTGFEAERDAAGDAAQTLHYEVRRCEDFGALEASPQQACLAGVRWADAVVLILGARYGAVQASGLSATHEEYREARERGITLAFVEQGTVREPRQAEFIEEVRGWQGGINTVSFGGPEDLMRKVTSALHEFELRSLRGPIDAAALRSRALAMLPDRSITVPTAHVFVATAPDLVILRPVDLEDPELRRSIRQLALLGDNAILDPEVGSTFQQSGEVLALEQSAGVRLTLHERGDVSLSADVSHRGASLGSLTVIIEEELVAALVHMYRLVSELIQLADPVGRLSHVLPVTALDRGYVAMRSQAEHAANPSTMTMPMAPERLVAEWPRDVIVRAALARDADGIAANVMAQFKRELEAH
jgi:Domain of unknown function (DUF4062)